MSVVAVYSGRAEGRAALMAAIEEARLRGSRLHVTEAVSTHHGYDQLSELSRRREALARLVDDLRRSGIDAEGRVLVGTGSRSELLLERVHEIDAELLVIGIRQRTAVGKLFLGSLSQDLILRAECAVLAVKARPGSDDEHA